MLDTMVKYTFLFLGIFSASFLFAQQDKKQVLQNLSNKFESYSDIAQQIWEFAELGYQEEKSVALLQRALANESFNITKGVAGMPTAFIAEYGEGYPIIAVLGEYDALPGLSQQAIPEKKSANMIAGHACGHHLFGTASVAAAIEVKNWMKNNNIKGTIRFYGCPAEEGGSGKVYLVREGLFNDVDAVLHWHPNALNDASAGASLANKSAKFRFYGVSAHAAISPEKGRSALDAVEAMDMMVNMMREHIPQEARIHYVITAGGKAPNVVPDFAEVYYYARHSNRNTVINIFDRIVKAAEGAALGTETKMEYEMIGGTHELLPNLSLQQLMYNNLKLVGGFEYTDKEIVFAEKIIKTLGLQHLNLAKVKNIQPYKTIAKPFGSTDVGDISFVSPTAGMSSATWVPGTPAHSWQAVAAGGTTIGYKGMMVAAKTIALTAIDLFLNHDILVKAKQELLLKRGKDFKYIPLLGDRPPALDYRK
jgi:aminobenzoyl-glutamate utilization protein B